MTTFDESLHPRTDGGTFATKTNRAPTATLEAGPVPFDVNAIIEQLRVDYAHAEVSERAAWGAYAYEKYSDGDGGLHLDFETYEDSASTELVGPDGLLESEDRLNDCVPESFENGFVRITRLDQAYRIWIEDEDSGESISADHPTSGRLTVDEALAQATAATTFRASVRDAGEQIAIVEAFERLEGFGDDQALTFTPATREGIAMLELDDHPGFFVSAADERQAAAFQFIGQEVSSIRVTRGDGDFTIERTITTPITRKTEILIDRVDGMPKRWTASSL